MRSGFSQDPLSYELGFTPYELELQRGKPWGVRSPTLQENHHSVVGLRGDYRDSLSPFEVQRGIIRQDGLDLDLVSMLRDFSGTQYVDAYDITCKQFFLEERCQSSSSYCVEESKTSQLFNHVRH